MKNFPAYPPTESNCSDLESTLSQIFEGEPDSEGSSHGELLADGDVLGRAKTQQPPLGDHSLCLYEYVVVTINIEATLARDFQRHVMYYQSRGKFFPLDSDIAIRRLMSLIDDFLDQHDIPTARRVRNRRQYGTLECPRFIPSPHLMLAFAKRLKQIEFLPVVVVPPGLTDTQKADILPWLHKSSFAAVSPTVPFQQEQNVFYPSSNISPNCAVFQQLHAKCPFTVGTIIDGQRTFLRSDSIRALKKLHPVAMEAAVATVLALWEKNPDQPRALPCGCDNHPWPKQRTSMLSRGDIVVDLDRSGVRSYESSPGSLDAEIGRVMQISGKFVNWCFHN
jgi:hypothetical protein